MRRSIRFRLLRDATPGADPSGAPAGGGGTPPTGTPAAGGTPADPPAPGEPPKADPPKDGDTDWKAEARKWEKLAKDNKNAATELDKLRTANMSEQEKAVADAEAKGRTAAAQDYGSKLAAAKFEAAVALAQVDLGEAADLIDTKQFLDDKGEVDEAAIKKAVAKLAKLAPAAAKPARSGGDHPGGGGAPNARPTSLSAAVKNSLGG